QLAAPYRTWLQLPVERFARGIGLGAARKNRRIADIERAIGARILPGSIQCSGNRSSARIHRLFAKLVRVRDSNCGAIGRGEAQRINGRFACARYRLPSIFPANSSTAVFQGNPALANTIATPDRHGRGAVPGTSIFSGDDERTNW